MGLINAEIELSNPRDGEIRPVKAKALVDTGALHLCVPERIALQLQLEELYKREVKTADGKSHPVPYMGPVVVKFDNRGCFTGALVFGDQVLLGAVPMEDMDVLISPSTQSLVVNPESPNIATSVAMRGFEFNFQMTPGRTAARRTIPTMCELHGQLRSMG